MGDMGNHAHDLICTEAAIAHYGTYTYLQKGVFVSITGRNDTLTGLYRADITLNGRPWIGIACGSPRNLAKRVLAEIITELHGKR